MSSQIQHRIDPAQPVASGRSGNGPSSSPPVAAGVGDARVGSLSAKNETLAPDEPDTELPNREQWLRLHAADLIDRLQSWEIQLDAREAKLNSRASQQDQRERSFRLQAQNTTTEQAEHQRAIERLRKQVEAQARRLAFRER